MRSPGWMPLLLLTLLLAGPLQAADGEGDYTAYVELNPAFVANYGGPGPLKYVKAEVSIKVGSDKAEGRVKHHEARFRNAILMLLSEQTDESLGSAEGREGLRLKALEAVRQIMVHEYGQEGYNQIEDLIFTSFVTQG